MPDQQPSPATSKFADDAERVEAATCYMHRSLGKRTWEVIRKTLRNRFGISDETEIMAIHATVIRRMKLVEDTFESDLGRMAQRKVLLDLLKTIEQDPRYTGAGSQFPEMAAAKQHEAFRKTLADLAKLDGLYLSDHLKAKAIAMALAGKMTDEQLKEAIGEEVRKRIEQMSPAELEALIAEKRAS